jgi:hypothetical protein
MKKITLLFLAATSIWAIVSCGSKAATPVSDLVKKTWTANIVKQNGTVVFTKGAASNTSPGYAGFKLNLSSPPAATLTDVDGNTFTGSYKLDSDTQLTLSGLNPAPTGTGGTITFTITTSNDTQLNLTRTTPSQKTGNTTNDYQLVNP